jgi:preprotein translocase subunit SecG
MYYFLFAIHLLIAVLLCVVVLLQQAKGDGLAGAFGGAGAGEAFFGARGVTTILHKATIYLGAAFMISSLVLVVASSNRVGGGSSLAEAAARRIPSPTALPLDAAPNVDAVVPVQGDDAIPAETSGTPDGAQDGSSSDPDELQGEGGG